LFVVTLPQKEQWVYQAVSDIFNAHSLLLSFPEVDVEHTVSAIFLFVRQANHPVVVSFARFQKETHNRRQERLPETENLMKLQCKSIPHPNLYQ